MPLRKTRLVALAAMASVGLLAGHSLTYLRLAPASSGPESLLEATGHGYLNQAALVSVALAAMSALFWFAGGILSSRVTRPGLARTAATLAVIQCSGFGIQEILERVIAGAPLSDLAVVLALGLPVQLLAAALGTLLVTALHKAGAAISRLLSRTGPHAPARPAYFFALELRFSSAVLPGGLRSRGPPALPS
jgi:hypothetical protein